MQVLQLILYGKIIFAQFRISPSSFKIDACTQQFNNINQFIPGHTIVKTDIPYF